MNILLINYEYPPLGGGGGIAMMEIAENLAERHTVHVLTSGAPGLESKWRHPSCDLTLHRAKVGSRQGRATASFRSMLDFLPNGMRLGRRLLEEVPFHIMNTWFAIPSGVTGGWLSRSSDVPHVLTVIGGDIYDPSKWYSPHSFPLSSLAVKWALRHATWHVAISSDIAERTKRYFHFNKPIEVVPLGIREPVYTPVAREELGLDPKKRYIVTVGRLVRRKDYPTLLGALASLDDKDVELLMIGDGPEQGNLQELAHRLGIAERVRFLGFVTDEVKYQTLANSDLFLLASLHEGFGVVYLEAMFCGLPIVAADQGGQTDILKDGITGTLVPVSNGMRMSAAIRSLLDDPERLAAIGRQNRERAQQYTISSVARQYERVYKKALAQS